MPIYEYRCPACARRFEELVALSAADDPRPCPTCSTPAERQLSAFAVHVAGRSSTERSSAGRCAGCRKATCAGC